MPWQQQSELDQTITSGQSQVVALGGRSFLVFGKITTGRNQYVGYEIESPPHKGQRPEYLDHRVRLFDLDTSTVHPLRSTLEQPYRLIMGTAITMYETVVEVIACRWQRTPTRSDEELAHIARQAAETMMLSGLWTDATLMMELWDQSVPWLGQRRVSDLGTKPFNRDDLEALAVLLAKSVKLWVPGSG